MEKCSVSEEHANNLVASFSFVDSGQRALNKSQYKTTPHGTKTWTTVTSSPKGARWLSPGVFLGGATRRKS
jgi:hypothetical protein